jgi:activator of HSP90 ATPase
MLAMPHRAFALKKPDNWHLIDKELQQQEEKAFEEKLTEEQRQFLRRERLVMLQF